jgi:hypothetical protein
VGKGSENRHIVGHAAVIGLCTWLIRSAALYAYRNYTREGKIMNLPRQAAAFDALMGVRSKLAEVGLSTTDVDRGLERSAGSMAQTLDALLRHEASVLINGEKLSVGERYVTKFLMDSERKRLKPGSIQDRNGEAGPKQGSDGV